MLGFASIVVLEVSRVGTVLSICVYTPMTKCLLLFGLLPLGNNTN